MSTARVGLTLRPSFIVKFKFIFIFYFNAQLSNDTILF